MRKLWYSATKKLLQYPDMKRNIGGIGKLEVTCPGCKYTIDYCHDKCCHMRKNPKAQRQMLNYIGIECANSMCCKDYLNDKYGFDTLHKGLKEMGMANVWRNRKARTRWYICKGCQGIYYCSRKCQKISWVNDGHRQQCKILQTFIIQ